jgi:hypothetical protein
MPKNHLSFIIGLTLSATLASAYPMATPHDHYLPRANIEAAKATIPNRGEILEMVHGLKGSLQLWIGNEKNIPATDLALFKQKIALVLEAIDPYYNDSEVLKEYLDLYVLFFQSEIDIPMPKKAGEEPPFDYVTEEWIKLYDHATGDPHSLYFSRIQDIELTRLSDGFIRGPSACEMRMKRTHAVH